MRGPSRFAIAKERAVSALDDLVPELFGSGRQLTHKYASRWAVLNKWRGDANISQMSVWRDGARRGAWRDYVSGDKGDVVDLVAYGLQGAVTAETRMAALEWLEDRFGLRNMAPARQHELAAAAAARRKELDEQAAAQQLSQRERVRKFFHSCEAKIIGTPVETYLRTRGIVLADVPNLSTALRYAPACQYWMGAQRDGEGNKIGIVPTFPAMIAQMISPAGALGACHYTFLEPDGSAKLQTGARGFADDKGRPHSAKLMYPSSSGLMIPLTHGPSGLRARDAAAASISDWWGFTEGIEDGLTAAICTPKLRMFAASSLAHLMGIPDHPAAKGYLVFQDGDWGKPEAVAQFERAMARLRQFGKPVETLAMPAEWGKDINAAINREGN